MQLDLLRLRTELRTLFSWAKFFHLAETIHATDGSTGIRCGSVPQRESTSTHAASVVLMTMLVIATRSITGKHPRASSPITLVVPTLCLAMDLFNSFQKPSITLLISKWDRRMTANQSLATVAKFCITIRSPAESSAGDFYLFPPVFEFLES